MQNIGQNKKYWHTNNIKMENNQKNRIKNCTYYYFDDIIKIEDFDFDIILLDEKSYENILIGAKSLRIKFDKVDEFIRVYDGTRYYLALKNMPFFIGLDTLQAKKMVSHNYARTKVDSYDSLPLEKTSILNMLSRSLSSFLIKIKSTTTKYIIFEKCLYLLAKNNDKTFLGSIIMLRFCETKIVKKASKNTGC